MSRAEYLDHLTRKHTAFHSFNEMLNALGGYAPSLRCSEPVHGDEITELSDAYDAAQQIRGYTRRACRS